MHLKQFALPLICTALSIVCSGQTTPTRVAIAVTDREGAVIAHADAKFSAGSDTARNASTDDLGQVMTDLKPGRYTLYVSGAGFRSYSRQIQVLAVKEEQIFPVVLEAQNLGGVQVTRAADTLELVGQDHPPLTLKLPDLKLLNHITVTIHNPHSNADETYSGVRLSDLLAKVGAPIGNDLRGKALADYIVATGADGYRAALALAEIDPAFHPGEVIVADAMSDKPLDDHSGPVKLVVTEDKRPARSVRNLVKIELKIAE